MTVEPHGSDHGPHVPPPSLWPAGFAVGVAVLLTGLIVGWHIVALGAVLTVVFGALWARDASRDMRTDAHAIEIEPEHRRRLPPGPAPSPAEGEAGMPRPTEDEIERYPRSKFLEGATLGIGGVIGGIVTLPVLGFAVAPAFLDQTSEDVDVGAVEDFPEGKFMITTFLKDPDQGEV
ncbi:MAG: hypothetical protein ACRDNX_04590, partial [Gaiellaceae bacterium]